YGSVRSGMVSASSIPPSAFAWGMKRLCTSHRCSGCLRPSSGVSVGVAPRRTESHMTLDEVHARAQKWWNVWGPCSGGVIVVYCCEGKLYTYYGGDAAPAEDSPNLVEESIDDYVRSRADAEVVDWLRAAGHLRT